MQHQLNVIIFLLSIIIFYLTKGENMVVRVLSGIAVLLYYVVTLLN